MTAYTWNLASTGAWASKHWGVNANPTSPSNTSNTSTDTATINTGTAEYNVNGIFVASLTVGGGNLVFNDINGLGNTTLNVSGNTNLSAGAITLNGNGNASDIVILCSANLNISGGTLTVNTSNASLLAGASGATISGGNLNISAGKFNDSGVLTVNGTGLYNQSGGAATVNGALTVSNSGATLNLSSGTLNANATNGANFSAGTVTLGGGTFNDAGLLNVSGAAVTASGATITTANLNIGSGSWTQNASTTTVNTNLSVTGGTFNERTGTTNFNVGNASFTGGTDRINANFTATGTINVGTALELDAGAALKTTSVSATALNVNSSTGNLNLNGGTVNVTAGKLSITNSAVVVGHGTVNGVLAGNGTVNATGGGTLDLASAIASSVGLTFDIANSSTAVLRLDGTVGTGDTFSLLGNAGTLQLSSSSIASNQIGGFQGTVAGMNVASNTTPTTKIDLSAIAVGTVNAATLNTTSDVVSVHSTGGNFNIQQTGSYTPGTFVDYQTDGVSGTDLFLSSVVCYVAGTQILTPDGEVAIEHLAAGQPVITLVDGEPVARPVKWIGRRRIDVTTHPHPERILPIRIERGALEDMVPQRDVLVSPDHAVVVDGVLVCARQLVNGTTIRQEQGWKSVDYLHVELAEHAILVADGLPAESYLDTGNQGFFANSGAPLVLHPDLTEEPDPDLRAEGSCLPFVADEGRVLPLWQLLADRAAALGRPAALPGTTTEPELRLLVKGRTVRPIYGENGLYIFPLTRGVREVQLISRADAPGAARPWSPDPRRLGVCVARLLLRGTSEVHTVAVDDPALSRGWWQPERGSGILARWTDGEAVLPLPAISGPAMLEVQLHGEMTYVDRPAAEIETQPAYKIA